MPAIKFWLVLALHLIGWDGGASILDQSQSEVKKYQTTRITFNTQLKTVLISFKIIWFFFP